MAKTSLAVATSFAVIESVYRYPEMTTVEQYILNLIYSPVLIHLYERVVTCNFMRILLFPFNIWIAEIVMGTFMVNVFGYRIWHYEDALALCNGHITLSFFFYWILMGIFASCYFWIRDELNLLCATLQWWPRQLFLLYKATQ